ncbi:Transposase DDE domain group 1, partial [Nitrosomonas communis]
HQVMIERFVASFKRVPKELILDFDATDDAVHGKQEGRFFHGIQITTAFCRGMYSARINCW